MFNIMEYQLPGNININMSGIPRSTDGGKYHRCIETLLQIRQSYGQLRAYAGAEVSGRVFINMILVLIYFGCF